MARNLANAVRARLSLSLRHGKPSCLLLRGNVLLLRRHIDGKIED